VRQIPSLPACLGAAFLVLLLIAGDPPPSYADGVSPGQQSGAIVQDTATGHVYIAQPVSNSLFVLTAKGTHLVTILRVPPSPTAIAVDTEHHLVYVASDPSGMVSVFDSRTFHVVHIYPLGGHPDGLTLLERGKTLLISDGVSGSIQQLAINADADQAKQVFAIGPAAAPVVLFAPATVYAKQRALVWARGFRSREPIEIDWGVQPLAETRANEVGIVTAHIVVPAQVDLGTHLVIVNGKWSTISESGLLNVVRAPVVHKLKRAVKKPTASPLLALLAQTVAIPIPPFLSALISLLPGHKQPVQTKAKKKAGQTQQSAPGSSPRATPAKSGAKHQAGSQSTQQPVVKPATPTVRVPLVALVALPLFALVGLTMRTLRRRGKRRKAKQQKDTGSVATPVKKAS
jgi:hypothetical protein